MPGIILFGSITTVLGLWMILNPRRWVELSVRYCQLPYMHPLEILLRLGFGWIFVTYAAGTRFPVIITYAGYLLITVGVGLAFLRPSYHRHIGITMIQRIGPWFRFAGLVALPMGIFLIYAAC